MSSQRRPAEIQPLDWHMILQIARKTSVSEAPASTPQSLEPDIANIQPLLRVLRRWCQVYDVAWEKELRVLDDYYASDGELPPTDASPPELPDVEEMRCPTCGHESSFNLVVNELVLVICDGGELCELAEGRWSNRIQCRCLGCNRSDVLSKFRKETLSAEKED